MAEGAFAAVGDAGWVNQGSPPQPRVSQEPVIQHSLGEWTFLHVDKAAHVC